MKTTHEKGAWHWWWQRVSAVALIPLSGWFVYAILRVVGEPYWVARAWVGEVWVAVGLGVYVGLVFWHGYLGMQVILEDYVASPGRLRMCLWGVRVVCWLGGLAGVGALVWVGWY